MRKLDVYCYKNLLSKYERCFLLCEIFRIRRYEIFDTFYVFGRTTMAGRTFRIMISKGDLYSDSKLIHAVIEPHKIIFHKSHSIHMHKCCGLIHKGKCKYQLPTGDIIRNVYYQIKFKHGEF
jgi:hypothetical protein